MKLKMLNFLNFQKKIYFFIFISSFMAIKNLELPSLSYPTAYTLLNHKIVLITDDGIRFFTSNLEEEKSKRKN